MGDAGTSRSSGLPAGILTEGPRGRERRSQPGAARGRCVPRTAAHLPSGRSRAAACRRGVAGGRGFYGAAQAGSARLRRAARGSCRARRGGEYSCRSDRGAGTGEDPLCCARMGGSSVRARGAGAGGR